MTPGKKLFSTDGETMLTARTAAKLLQCAPDYVSRLCREGKLEGSRHQGQWFVSPNSLKHFEVEREAARSARAESLAQERRQETQAFAYASASPAKKVISTIRGRMPSISLPKHAAAALLISMMLGGSAFASSSAMSSMGGAGTSPDLAAAVARIESPFFSSTIFSLGNILHKIAELFAPGQPIAIVPATNADEKPAQVPVAPIGTIASLATTTQTFVTNTTNTYPVIERTLERVVSADTVDLSHFVTYDFLNAQITRLQDSLTDHSSGGGGITNFSSITVSDIPDLSSLYLSITGGTLTGPLALTSLITNATSTLAGLALNVDCSVFNNGGKLTTDSAGNVICDNDTAGSGSGTPGGSNTQVQFNDAGDFGGDAGFTYSKSADRLTVSFASTTAVSADSVSTTNLAISSVANSLLKTVGGVVTAAVAGTDYQAAGNYATFAYPFPSNATTTSIAFNGGLSGNLTGSLAGNATTATALQTGRTINGVSFDGTSNITVDAASSTLLANNNTFSGTNTFSNPINGSITGNAGTVTGGVYTTTFGGLFDNRLSATTSLPNIVSLANLSLPYSQLTGTPAAVGYPFPSNATTTSIAFNGGLTASSAAVTYASTTGISSSYASTTQLVAGTLALTNALTVANGGTGSTTLSGILRGNGTGGISSVVVGPGLSFDGTTLSALSGTAASSTLLSDNNTFSGANTFSSPITASITGNAGTVTSGVYTTTFNSLFDPRFISQLAATSSVASITTLNNLSLPYSQLTGAPGASAYSFPLAGNATSTLTQFNGGLTAYASSTITSLTSVLSTSTSATSSNFAITGITSSLLKTLSNGAVVAAVAGTDYVANTSGDWTGTFDGQEGAYYLNAANLTNFGAPFAAALAATTTSALAEGSNLYYQDERVDDRVSALLQAGSGVNLIYNDGANTLTISSTGGGGGGSDVNWSYFNGSGIRPATSTNQVLIGGASTSTLLSPLAKLGVFGGASIDYASTTAITATSASTTNLVISGISGSLLKTVGGVVTAAVAGTDYQAAGNYATFAYPFPSNATSTSIAFNGGLTGVLTGSVVGNASTATALQTGRTINGVTFDGTANIVVAAASSTLLTDNNTFSGTNTFSNPIVASVTGNAGTVTNGVYTTTFNGLFDPRFITDLAATSSIASIVTLPNLSLPYSQLTGTPSIYGYPFPLAGNATSTLTQFNGGLTAYASSTIGNGLAAGGLTVAGNATTTGVLYVGGTGTSTFASNISLAGSIIPATTNTYSLGRPGNTFKDLFLGPGSLYINGQEVIHTDVSNNVVVSSDAGENLELQTSGAANIILNPSASGLLQIGGAVQFAEPGYSITTTNSGALPVPFGVAAGNITVSGSTISANNTNGDIALTPNGNGDVYQTVGRFGIGTTNPSAKLDVLGDILGETKVTSGYFVATSSTASALPYASSTALSVSGALYTPVLSSLLKTDAAGKLVAATAGTDYLTASTTFAYPFPSNATSTSITFSGGLTGALTGNASTATALQTGRTINGVTFDGTTNITINAASSTLLADNNTFSGTNTFSNPIVASVTGNAGTVTDGVYTSTFNSLFDPRFITQLAATSSIASITTLPNLSLPASQVTGLFAYPFPSNATTTNIAFNGGATFAGATTTALAVTGSSTIASVLNVGGVLNANGGVVGALTGNASTATALQTGRTVNGVTFDGTSNITINAASSTLLANNNTFSGANSFTGNTTLANATSTNFAISGIASSLLKTTASGSVVAAIAGTDYLTAGSIFAYPFPSNATTTSIAFNGGLTASTIVATNATTTSLGISGITSALLKTTASGSVIAAVAGTDYESSLTFTTGLNRIGNIVTNSGVTSATGTLNQINVSSNTGDVTFSLPTLVALTNLTVSSATTTNLFSSGLAGNTAAFGGAATTTIDAAGNLAVAGTLTGAGLSACSGTADKLLWNAGVFSCGVDQGSSGGSGDVSWTFFNGSAIRVSTTTNQVLIGASATTSLAQLQVVGGVFTDNATSSMSLFGGAVSGNVARFGSTGTTTIDAAGNVGIGTSSPAARLAVAGGNILQTASGNPTLAGSVSTSNHTYATAVSGTYAYVADLAGGLRIMDIANPAAPAVVGSFAYNGASSAAVSVAVAGRYAYVGDTTAGLVVIDVSNPAAPTVVSSTNILNAPWSMALSGKYLYAADGDDQALKVIDVSNPAAPTVAGTWAAGGSSQPYSVALAGKYAYVGDFGDSKIYIIDISNPAAPARTATFAAAGIAPVGLYASGRYLYVADIGQGFYSLDVSNPNATPTLVGSYNPSGNYNGVSVAGQYAYVADSDGNAIVLNIANQAAPVLVGSYATGGSPLGITVVGKYAYVSANTGGLVVVDINGTTLPAANIASLQADTANVADTLTVGNNIYAGGGLDVGISGIFSRGTIAAYIASSTQANAAVATFMGGNVGIGTTSPFASLSVVGSGFFTGNLSAANITATGTLAALNILATGSTTLQNFTAVNATTTNATTTAFAISGISSALLKTLSNGAIVAAVAGTDYATPANLASAYPFQLAGNATSTLTQFNGGLTAYASTTIGAGGQTTGLTISGGATTTGNAYIAGNITTPGNLTLGQFSTFSGYNIYARYFYDISGGGSFINTGYQLPVTINTQETGTVGEAIKGLSGQTGDLLQFQNNLGGVLSTFTANGSLGIGTTSPANLLDINGSGSVAAMSITGTTNNTGVGIQSRSGYGLVQGLAGGNPGVLVLNAFGGNVGIGTTTPPERLSVSGSVASYGQNTTDVANVSARSLDYASTFKSTNINFFGSAVAGNQIAGVPNANLGALAFLNTANALIETNNAAPLIFGTAGTERMRIDENGNVGIGTISPSFNSRLEVNGSASSPNNSFFVTTNTYSASSAGSLLRIGTGAASGNTYGVIDALISGGSGLGNLVLQQGGGNVGIGTTTPAYKLDVWGVPRFHPMTDSNLEIQVPISLSGGVALRSINDAGNAYKNIEVLSNNFVINAAAGTGNVGIGTTTPGYKLDIWSTAAAGDLYAGGWDANTNYNAINLNGLKGAGNFNFISSITDKTLYINRPSGADINFGENNNQNQMVIKTGGNVGIGTASPLDTLEVKAPGVFAGLPASSGTTQAAGLRVSQSAGGGVLDMGFATTSAGASWLQSTNSTNLGTNYALALNPNGGNVGIGTTNPQQALQVSSANYYQGILVNGNNAPSVGFVPSTGTTPTWKVGISGNNGANFAISTGATNADQLTIDSTGNVGIGTTTPYGKLAISGVTDGSPFNISGTAPQILFSATGGSAAQRNWSFRTDSVAYGDFSLLTSNVQGGDPATAGTTRLYVGATGNVGIGTTGPVQKLDVSGYLNFGGATASFVKTASKGILLDVGSGANDLEFNTATAGGGYGFKFYGTGSDGTLRLARRSNSSTWNDLMAFTDIGNVGIGTTTPGSLFSIGNTGGINFTLATSTFSTTGGLNIAAGCYAVNGTCLSTGGPSNLTGAVTSVGNATSLGSFSSANLLGALTDQTGTGFAVFSASPTFTGTLTAASISATSFSGAGTGLTGTGASFTAGHVTTNANLTGAINSSGNATLLGSFSSASLLGALTDETGSGSAVFATSPTFGGHVIMAGPAGYVLNISNNHSAAGDAAVAISSGATGGDTTSSEIVFYNGNSSTVQGSINRNGAANVAYTTTSDRRLKENIATTTAGLSTLMQISVDDFNFISDPSKVRQQGFLAQELYKIYPIAVSTNGDDGTTPLAAGSIPWSVDYGRITPLIIQSVQDLNAKVEENASSSNATTTPQALLQGPFASATDGLKSAINSALLAIQNIAQVGVRELGQAVHASVGVFAQVFTQTLTATVVNADTVNTKQLCLDGLCVNKEQLQQLLNGQGTVSSGGGSVGDTGGDTGTDTGGGTPPADTGGDTGTTTSAGGGSDTGGGTVGDTGGTPPADQGSGDTGASGGGADTGADAGAGIGAGSGADAPTPPTP